MTLYDESDDSTSWDERREFEERISKGFALTSAETRRLIRDAEAGERASAIVSALEQTLKERFGMVCVDATTDDDEGMMRIELVRADPHSPHDSIGE